VSRLNHLYGELKKVFVLVEERVYPLSWQPPASWGPPTTVWKVTIKGLPVDSMHFAGGQQANRCAWKVHGYDD
jgi:hypothetical protein